MLASLRRFAEGSPTPSPVDAAIARALGSNRNARTIAKRLLARIDARPSDARDKAFGKDPPAKKPTGDQLSAAFATAGLQFGGVGMTPSGSLPDEAVDPPTTYAFAISGLAPVELSDGDADGDEIVAMTTFVTTDGSKYTTKTATAPTQGALTGVRETTPIPLAVPVYDGAAKLALAVSVVVEVDGDAQAMRDEFATMLGLAQGHAQLLAQAGDTDVQRLTRFAMSLDYTVALLAVADPERWPAGALQKTMMHGPAGMKTLYATPAATDGAVPWKLAHDHDLPSGRYKLYYDVPSPVRPRKTLVVKMTKVEALDPEPSGADLVASVGIDDAFAEKTFARDDNAHTISWIVRRKLAPDRAIAVVDLLVWDRESPVSGWWFDGHESSPCGAHGDVHYPPCPDNIEAVDVNPDAAWGFGPTGSPSKHAQLRVDVATGEFSGPGQLSGKLGDALTLQGDAVGIRGRVKVVITLEP